MFEGLVRQLILGYLGRYIKDIQKEQLKITLWNEVLLLENVELILEAFDYLQLPFALKEGRVGRLSIKIPWKKLGWDPIIITIEDVFVSACQRDDEEWSAEAVEKRELSGKKAKLAAAELAKLSRRVCENQAGQSFSSYLTAKVLKVLEGIQVSIKNVHVLYRDMLTNTGQMVIGLRFSSLSVMKQNLTGFYTGIMKGGQVNKIVEMHGLEIYCSSCRETMDLVTVTHTEDFDLPGYGKSVGQNDLYLLAPIDVLMSLTVCRSGSGRNDAPQYSINVELSELVMSLSEFQLGQILTLWDYLCICDLRKKYGRYRPWDKPLSRKYQGWQVLWWHYAQQSVLSDVRRKLKKNSWKYFGERLHCRRKYVSLYKTKLKNLREEQSIDGDVLRELEQMEKEFDLEDILDYRCIAESELQEFLKKSKFSLEVNGVSIALEKSAIDERVSTRPRGWLNWLSRGMLGAGGTDDSGQFSGVISDEVIKDIYDATDFKPTSSHDSSSSVADDVLLSEVKILIHKVSITLWIKDCGRAAAKLVLEELIVVCKLWEETLALTSSVKKARIINQGNKQNILLIGKADLKEDVLDIEKPSVCIQVNSSPANQEIKLLVEVIQPLEVTYDSEFLLNIMEFYHVFKTYKFHQERVMLSLNEFEDVRARLVWKAKYTLSSRQRVVWDVYFGTISINVILRNAISESSELVLQIGSFHFATIGELGSASDIEDEFYILENLKRSISTSDISTKIELRDLYNKFELQVADFEMKVLTPCRSGIVSVVEKTSASVSLTSCAILDESMGLQLKVNISIQSLCVCFSPTICLVGLGILANENWLRSDLDSGPLQTARALGIKSIEETSPRAVYFTVVSNLKSVVLRIDLENDKENDCSLLLNLEEANIRYAFAKLQECSVSSRTLKIFSYSVDSDNGSVVLCSSGNSFPAQFAKQQGTAVDHSNERGDGSNENTYAQQCFLLHFEESEKRDRTFYKYEISLIDCDFHCYPYIIRLLIEFSEKILRSVASNFGESSFRESPTPLNCFDFKKFGFSNLSESGSAECTSISVENFPFITVHNVSSLSEGDSSFIQLISEWRNTLKIRESQVRIPEFSRRSQVSHPKSRPRKDETVLANGWDGTDSLVDLNVCRVRVHFHDSSSIVGTVSLTTSKSFLSSCEDCLDMLFSIEGLSLCSSWWTNNIQESLWGPSLKNISPILNLRVIKYKDGPLRSHCKISFSIQHVSCILLPEFLEVIIGYFSLSDWKTEESNPELENCTMISYMFEIVDSYISTPAEECDSWVLKLVVPHLYGSFILDHCSGNVLKGIPSECSVAANKIANRNHCLNLYGRDLSLSLLSCSRDELDASLVGQKSGDVCESFIEPLSADLWVLIPAEIGPPNVNSSSSTCVMVRVHNCQLIAKGGYLFFGFAALLKIIDQFSSVDIVSKYFRTDILQFRNFKKSMKENETFVSEASMVLVDTKCCVSLLSIHFYHSLSDAVSSQQVARADMNFVLSASFRNEITQFLNVSFRTLVLYSNLSSVVLAECTLASPTSSVLDIDLSTSDGGEKEILFSLSSVDVWLHFFDWTVVINLMKSYTELAKTSFKVGSSVTLSLGPGEKNENMIMNAVDNSSISFNKLSGSPQENMEQNATFFIMKSENLGIKVYIPVRDSRESFSTYNPYGDSSKTENGVGYNYMAISLESRCSELIVSGSKARIKSHIREINGILEMCNDKALARSSPTMPLFQFSRVNIEAEIHNDQPDRLHTLVAVQCESLELWLSYQIFYFLKCLSFSSPDSGSAQPTLSSVDLNLKLKKISILLTDGRWSAKAPLLEALVKNFIFTSILFGIKLDCSVAGDLQVNYNNIRKVCWEPFVEPWKFQLIITRLHEVSALLNSAAKIDIHLNSTEQLNLNVTESFTEAVFRAIEMVKDAFGVLKVKDLSRSQGSLNSQICEPVHPGKYAPYILQNLTSLPLMFHVCQSPLLCAGDRNDSVLKDGTFVDPGASCPIYIDGTPDEQLLRHKPAHSSERLSDKQLFGVAHNYVIIKFDGTAVPSTPISMDLVGPSCFEVDFSKSLYKREVHDVMNALKSKKAVDENNQIGSRSGFVVPVVCDVSVQRYCKLVRLYSTVILFNGTSVPIEVRFDIPLGLSPKILDPIYPGQELPLPLHLAEAGRVRWRPLDQNVLWSEAHNISNVLSTGSRIGLLRYFVCYPSHPNSDPFRCCISVQQYCFPPSVEKIDRKTYKDDRLHKYLIHQVCLSCPLVVKNFLPKALTVTLDCGGVTRTALLTEVESFFYHVESSHDLEIVFNLHGFQPSFVKFPRTETFSGTAKFTETKFCQSETLTFNPDSGDGLLYISVEKTIDAVSGSREICIYVPYLLYNCTAFPLLITDSTKGENGHIFLVPSCYDFGERNLNMSVKDGLGLLSSDLDFLVAPSSNGGLRSSSKSHNVSRASPATFSGLNLGKPRADGTSIHSQKISSEGDTTSRIKSNLRSLNLVESRKLQACMYAPDPNSPMTEKLVRVSRYLPEDFTEHKPKSSWSSPFFLFQPTGSTTVPVPVSHPSRKSADVISVTSSSVAGRISGKTRVVTFQPRYVISNACSKDLFYKQKGTDSSLHLGVGQHSHLQWPDMLRELLLSVRFDELGWQWSGCFSPDNLGDTQVKMRNYVTGSVSMIRVEVQNADVSIRDEKIVGSLQGNSGTNLILLSDDDTGFMPFRIDNFSRERLRVYQQSCETFETIIQSYTSCPYAWDEPCCAHRLTIEVPGQRVLGSYTLDHLKDYMPVPLSSTSEKPERTLVVSVHAEGAVKVLSVIDSSYHVLNDANDASFSKIREKKKHEQKEEVSDDFNEKISISLSFIGISLMNSNPQELIFACAKKTKIDLLQSQEQQKFSLKIECLQIDNQLQSTPYPVILSFNREHRSNVVGQTRNRADNAKLKIESVLRNSSNRICEPDICLSAAKWRNRDASLVSFEYISLRLADFHLQVDQEIVLGLFDFYRATLSRSQVEASLTSNLGFKKDSSALNDVQRYVQSNDEQFQPTIETLTIRNGKSGHLQHSIVPIGAPWQQIYLLARRQKKVYVETFDLSPIKLILSFSSTPWMLRNTLLASGESIIHRGLVALADVEGAQIYLGQLNVTHHMASWDSIQEIIIRHYTRQLLQEMYKVFGSAGVIGNPMGFARSVSLGIKDFVSAPAKNVLKSPAGLIMGMAQGTSSLLSNTVYALSDAATQFSRAAHKGIVALTFDDQAVAGTEKQQKGISSHNKGVVDEFLEGLTGLLQSPIRGAEKHGLLGVLSGVAMGMTGLVARPAASILDATGRTAQSIRNRSKLHQFGSHGLRVRLPRPLRRELPLRPYSWEDAVGTSILSDANSEKFKDGSLVLCKMLKQGGKLVIVTQTIVLIINCSSLVDLGKPDFQGFPAEPDWVIEAQIGLDSVIHADTFEGVVHIVGSNSDPLLRQIQNPRVGSGRKQWNNPSNLSTLPLYQTDLEFTRQQEADNFLQVLLSAVEEGKEHGWGNVHLLHQSNLKQINDTSL